MTETISTIGLTAENIGAVSLSSAALPEYRAVNTTETPAHSEFSFSGQEIVEFNGVLNQEDTTMAALDYDSFDQIASQMSAIGISAEEISVR